jgi:phage shock protein A
MFEDLRRAFREAVNNFREEVGRDEVSGTVDRLLKGMIEETASAKADLATLEDQVVKARAQAEAETRQVATCERRERMARDIGDEETAQVAVQYRKRHAKRLAILEQKIVALEQEVELRTGEVSEMLEKVKEARARREALIAEAGRPGARAALSESDRLFSELDRMAERIGDTDDAAQAARELGSEFDDLTVDPYAPPRRPEVDVDARLAELKRRMGETD